ncbi:hypothetical protein L2Y96_04010 [Luteibacter aegosomaticola]|uniref:hypothetical protein n=1 Tax=Luteibacter aegosomaticola TaxID=2911538 RepID=UPI001FFBCB88|nr:hypothetical protein [Luteibacter aegosomaticola]UPG90950.1 hypothetical protein L2Y96_04010 [Luteibacter aegosomaticola]
MKEAGRTNISPSKISMLVVSASSLAFLAGGLWLHAVAITAKAPLLHAIGLVCLGLPLSAIKKSVEAYSVEITASGISQLSISIRHLRIIKLKVVWSDVIRAQRDNEYFSISSRSTTLKIDMTEFWNARLVETYITDQLGSAGVLVEST